MTDEEKKTQEQENPPPLRYGAAGKKTTKQESEEVVDIPEVNLAEEYKDKWLRAAADYQNLKKDTMKAKVEWIKFANAGLILELLPILNHFREAVKHVPEEQREADWVVGISHIKKQLEDFFKDLGIEEIKTVGEKFNPEFHEAVSQKEVAGKEPDEVVEELRPGYTMHGKVIEPAKVVVSK